MQMQGKRTRTCTEIFRCRPAPARSILETDLVVRICSNYLSWFDLRALQLTNRRFRVLLGESVRYQGSRILIRTIYNFILIRPHMSSVSRGAAFCGHFEYRGWIWLGDSGEAIILSGLSRSVRIRRDLPRNFDDLKVFELQQQWGYPALHLKEIFADGDRELRSPERRECRLISNYGLTQRGWDVARCMRLLFSQRHSV